MRLTVQSLRDQFLDRISMASDFFDRHVTEHVKECEHEFELTIFPPELKEKIEAISSALADLYQAIGALEGV
jgi:hypothetical protein